jgi:UDP-3-O-[3-hydroxymyristoyl] glucosamine N-acyltransferase
MENLLNILAGFEHSAIIKFLVERKNILTYNNSLSHAIPLINITDLTNACEGSLIWVASNNNNALEVIKSTKATYIICGENVDSTVAFEDKLIIRVKNPRLFFIQILSDFLKLLPKVSEIHSTAVIDSESIIGKNVSIGANSVIGKCEIGDDTIIGANVTIYDRCIIKKRVKINSGTVIGADGFGYHKLDDGTLLKFPHIGSVLIEDDVEIGANTCIDRATLGLTHLKKGVKIDNLVHIAHNVIIGENSTIIALSMVGGSTRIGDNTWIAPSVALRDGLIIGADCMIGMGSIVTKNVPDGETWLGNPAKNLHEFLELQKKLKSI